MKRYVILCGMLAALAAGCSSSSDVALEKAAPPPASDAAAPPMQNVDLTHRGLSFRPGGAPAAGGAAAKVKG